MADSVKKQQGRTGKPGRPKGSTTKKETTAGNSRKRSTASGTKRSSSRQAPEAVYEEDDLLVYEDEPLPVLLKKLERYYGKKFLYPKGIDRYQVSGKLDLKERLEDVLHTISFSFPVRFEIEGEVVNVYIE